MEGKDRDMIAKYKVERERSVLTKSDSSMGRCPTLECVDQVIE